MKITVKGEAVNWLNAQPKNIRQRIIDVIREKAPYASDQMVVMGFTCDGDWPWIERCMKDYTVKPSVRILFHIVSNPTGIYVDKIAYRCDNPYGDGR